MSERYRMEKARRALRAAEEALRLAERSLLEGFAQSGVPAVDPAWRAEAVRAVKKVAWAKWMVARELPARRIRKALNIEPEAQK